MQRLNAAVDLERQSPALVVQRWRQGLPLNDR
jgi:glycine betaine/choline ABC-type transport system substrate-binding protein